MSNLKATLDKIMRLWTILSSWVSTSVSPGGCEICHCSLSSLQVHCTDVLFWALSMQAQWYSCARICPCRLFFWCVRPNSSRRGQEQPIFVLLFFKSMINQLYISLTVARWTLRLCTISTALCHSTVGMLLPWLSCPRPDVFKELRFSSLLVMSAHVFLYWCRSREYTKGSQAALL